MNIQPASKFSWDSQDFGDVNMVVKMAHFHKSSRPQWVKRLMSYRLDKLVIDGHTDTHTYTHTRRLRQYPKAKTGLG